MAATRRSAVLDMPAPCAGCAPRATKARTNQKLSSLPLPLPVLVPLPLEGVPVMW